MVYSNSDTKMWINGMYILDYPARLTTEPITEERKEQIEESRKMIAQFVKENNIKIIMNPDEII